MKNQYPVQGSAGFSVIMFKSITNLFSVNIQYFSYLLKFPEIGAKFKHSLIIVNSLTNIFYKLGVVFVVY
jgi:hypothetical protein